MPTIDMSKMVTAEAKTASALSDRMEAARLECRARIFAVADATAQINLAAAAAADLLSAQDRADYAAGLGWIAAMRAAWQTLGQSGADIEVDSNWPEIPAGVAELADRF